MEPNSSPGIVVHPCPANEGLTPGRVLATVSVGIVMLICGTWLILALRSGSHIVQGKVTALALGMGFLFVVFPVLGRLLEMNATVFVTGEKFGMTTLLGRRRVFAIDDLAGVVLCTVVYPGMRAKQATAFFISTSGKRLFQLNSRQWELDDLERICNACGVPLVGSWDQICWGGFKSKLAAMLPKAQSQVRGLPPEGREVTPS